MDELKSLLEKARQCKNLALGARDPATIQTLLSLAAEFMGKADWHRARLNEGVDSNALGEGESTNAPVVTGEPKELF